MLLTSFVAGTTIGVLYFTCICCYVITRPDYTEKKRVHFDL